MNSSSDQVLAKPLLAALTLCGAMLMYLPGAASAQGLRPNRTSTPSKAAAGIGPLVFCNGLEINIVGCAGGTPPELPPLVLLEQLAPRADPSSGSTSIQFRAGWPLIFRASVRGEDMLGIGQVYGEQGHEALNYHFAEVGQGASLVFDNPDGNWSYSIPPPPLPRDESILDFYPDPGDVTGVADEVINSPMSHDPARRFNLRPQFGGPLPQAEPDGTQMQTALQDGVQFGADDDFPGLVILSNVGVGIVMETLANGWTPVVPRQARNLAGFTNSVGYELSDELGRTSITSTLIVPRFLFSHIRIQDPCVGAVSFNGSGEPTACAGASVQRIDGGPVTPYSSANRNDESLVELRAFVVAPVWNSVSNRLESLDTVVDMNGDGVVSAVDASLMGREVLSNEIVFNFRQIGSDVSSGRISQYASIAFCNGLAKPQSTRPAGSDYLYDIDGNGYDVLLFAAVCPGGGSGVTQPPR
jgi:hypothetical protein